MAGNFILVQIIGVDKTKGRFGDVKLRRCRDCGRHWLHYHVEYEAFTGSGRWYMGLISPQDAVGLRPEDAVEYLNSLEWCFNGGSYFDGKTGRWTGPVRVDLMG
jgi:hypothetical protein